MVRAAVRGATSMVGDSVVRYKTMSGVGRSGSVEVEIVVAKGSVMEASTARAEAGR
jgi:hypothetical protein